MNETLCDRVKNSEREGKDNNRVFNILYSTITTIKNCYVKEKSIPSDVFPFWLIWTYPSQIF